MMKEAKPFVIDYVYAQSVECEEPCEGRLSRTVLWEGEGETPSLYSTYDPVSSRTYTNTSKTTQETCLNCFRTISSRKAYSELAKDKAKAGKRK